MVTHEVEKGRMKVRQRESCRSRRVVDFLIYPARSLTALSSLSFFVQCHRYWPDPTSNPPTQALTYGDVKVLHVSTVPHRHFLIRTFVVQRVDEEPRTVKQFAYTSWPDHVS